MRGCRGTSRGRRVGEGRGRRGEVREGKVELLKAGGDERRKKEVEEGLGVEGVSGGVGRRV